VSTRTCCLLSALLGNRTMSLRIVEAVRSVANGPVDETWFTDETYRRHPAPRWVRRSSELEAEWVATRLLRDGGLPEADAYVVNTVVLAQAARRLRPRARLIVATDATPALTDRLRARAGLDEPSRARRAFRRLQHSRFRAFAPSVERWLPISQACRDSLVEDYGVPDEHCVVTSAPQRDVDVALPRRYPGDEWRLLFVGNDFARKGGPELCSALEQLPQARLTIVSRDPEARRHADAAPPGRILLRDDVTDPAALVRTYREAHLLVHPTFVDHYSHVICEGLARGLPFVVTAGTPPAELVQRSGAGAAIDWPPAPDEIARAVRAMLDSPDRHALACARALAFARRELRAEQFAQKIAEALGRPSPASLPPPHEGASGGRFPTRLR
jgi:glycosyltransferase involved in cell wall biosynthesis